MHHGVDEREMGEGLREVAEVTAGQRVDLLAVQLERAGVREQPLAESPRPAELPDLDEGGDEPERADREAPLLARQTVVGLLGLVPEDEAIDRQLVGDREDRGADPRVVRGKEADERDEEVRRVERRRVVVLREDTTLVDAVGEDVGLDLVGGHLPALRELRLVAQLGEPGTTIRRYPAYHLRRREVLRVAADLPDPPVGVAPVPERFLDLTGQDRPDALVETVA